MKKVWILEKFENHEEMLKLLEGMKDALEFTKTQDDCTDEVISGMNASIARYTQFIADNPDGTWIGLEGKANYRTFCDVAKAAIRRNRKMNPEIKLRVVEGEIEDGARYWLGYKINKVNDGVYRYLMATL